MSEIEIIINALMNMSNIDIYNPKGLSDKYKKPYNKLLDDLVIIKRDLGNKYRDAVAEDNINTESINPDYNRECQESNMSKRESGLHTKKGYKKYTLKDDVKFWARSDEDAELYKKKISEKLDKLKSLS